MGLSATERNRRKRERKKREREECRKEQENESKEETNGGHQAVNNDAEIEYIVEPMAVAESEDKGKGIGRPEGVPREGEGEEDGEMASILRRFQERAAVVISDEDKPNEESQDDAREKSNYDHCDYSDDDSDDEREKISKRKLREMIRPSVAELKRRVKRPDLVEAHDVTAFDPDFLIQVCSFIRKYLSSCCWAFCCFDCILNIQ